MVCCEYQFPQKTTHNSALFFHVFRSCFKYHDVVRLARDSNRGAAVIGVSGSWVVGESFSGRNAVERFRDEFCPEAIRDHFRRGSVAALDDATFGRVCAVAHRVHSSRMMSHAVIDC